MGDIKQYFEAKLQTALCDCWLVLGVGYIKRGQNYFLSLPVNNKRVTWAHV
jgi:hypothetical protein